MLRVGDKAPLFESIDQNGNRIALNSFLGKKVVLFFYPKDNTPGCTLEACGLRDAYSEFQKTEIAIIGISVDSQKSHYNFAQKFQLPYSLVVDDKLEIVEQYGVWIDKQMYGKTYKGTARTTFLLDENLHIKHIIAKVDTKNSAQQILDLF